MKKGKGINLNDNITWVWKQRIVMQINVIQTRKYQLNGWELTIKMTEFKKKYFWLCIKNLSLFALITKLDTFWEKEQKTRHLMMWGLCLIRKKRGQKNKGTLQHFFVSFLVLKESKVASLKKRTFGKWYIGSYDHQKLWKTLVQMVLLKVLEINLKHKLHFCALHDMKLYSLPPFLIFFLVFW